MSERTSIIVISLLVVTLAVVSFFALHPGASTVGTPSVVAPASYVPPPNNFNREPVPAGVVVPEIGDQSASSGVAVPQSEIPSTFGGNPASQRSFDISVANNAFTPNTVVVNNGDVVDLYITAIDKNYDFTQPDLGLVIPLPKGQKRKIEFTMTATGKFTFFCSSCGGIGAGPIGYIIAK